MREKYKQVLKEYLPEQIKKRRIEMGLTQARMARKLRIDVRTYCDLEKGRSVFSAITLIKFLTECCPDPLQILNEIKAEFDKIPKNPED